MSAFRLSLLSKRRILKPSKYMPLLSPHNIQLRQAFDGVNLSKFNRPDRWRVEPFPIAEPYHANPGTWIGPGTGTVPSMDGNYWERHFSWQWIFVYYIYAMSFYTMYIMRQFMEYENIYTWGREEALAQMNMRDMRDEELIFLWVRYNKKREEEMLVLDNNGNGRYE